MGIGACRVYRLSAVVTISLTISYAVGLAVPFFSPLMALFLAVAPSPPLGLKQLFGLIVVVLMTLLLGVLMVPLISHYTFSGLIVVALGIFLGTYLATHNGKVLPALFLIMGLTLISAMGSLSTALALVIIEAMVLGIIIAVICHWLVYPFFPEQDLAPEKPAHESHEESFWISMRATIIVMPIYLLTLTNPLVYLPIIMKAVALGQQESQSGAKAAGIELLGSTFLGGCYAIVIWLVLDLVTTLWIFSLLIFLVTMYFATKIYALSKSKYGMSFWQNSAVTMIILLGSAVQDSANGKDVYKAFLVRMGLFIFVTLYAWAISALLDYLRDRKRVKSRCCPQKV